jgi:hypothetical protein
MQIDDDKAERLANSLLKAWAELTICARAHGIPREGYRAIEHYTRARDQCAASYYELTGRLVRDPLNSKPLTRLLKAEKQTKRQSYT